MREIAVWQKSVSRVCLPTERENSEPCIMSLGCVLEGVLRSHGSSSEGGGRGERAAGRREGGGGGSYVERDGGGKKYSLIFGDTQHEYWTDFFGYEVGRLAKPFSSSSLLLPLLSFSLLLTI